MELMANVLKRISSCIYFLNTQRTNNNKIILSFLYEIIQKQVLIASLNILLYD